MIGLILGLLLIMKLTHGLFKILSFTISALILVGIVLGIMVVYDAFKFQQSAFSEPMIYAMLDTNGIAVTQIALNPTSENPIKLLQDSEIADLNSKDYDKLLSTYFKIWGFYPGLIDELSSDQYEFNGASINKADLKNLLYGSASLNDYNGDNEELKGALFAGIVVNEVAKNPVFLLKQFKAGNIMVEKETILFKFVKHLPVEWIQKLFSSTVSKVTEKVGA